jgi:uncharacterized membrane protein
MIDFEPILVLAILAEIHGPHSMDCAFRANLWINAGIVLQCLFFAYYFIMIFILRYIIIFLRYIIIF